MVALKTGLMLVGVLFVRVIPATGYLDANVPKQPVSSPSTAPSPAQGQMSIENFLSGQVVKVSPNQVLLRQPGRGTDIVLRLLPKTIVWDGLWVNSIPIAVGDQISARVEPRRADGSFDAQKIWVNLVNLVGDVSKVEKKAEGLQLSLENRLLGSVIVNVDPRTAIARQGKEAPFAKSTVELRKGQVVRIMGRRLRNGSVMATKLRFEE